MSLFKNSSKEMKSGATVFRIGIVNTFKYHVSCTDGKISVRINLLFCLYFPPSPHLIYVCFCPVGLSLLYQHFQQVLWVLKLLQNRNIYILDGTTVENKGKLILKSSHRCKNMIFKSIVY